MIFSLSNCIEENKYIMEEYEEEIKLMEPVYGFREYLNMGFKSIITGEMKRIDILFQIIGDDIHIENYEEINELQKHYHKEYKLINSALDTICELYFEHIKEKNNIDEEEAIICPKCNKNELNTNILKNALSRRDNKTYICNECATMEALEDYLKLKEQNKES